jgi:hypothetical protein
MTKSVKFSFFLMAILAIATVCSSGCKKDNDDDGGENGGSGSTVRLTINN